MHKKPTPHLATSLGNAATASPATSLENSLDKGNSSAPSNPSSPPALRRGWTTGANAAAAAMMALTAFHRGQAAGANPPVAINLPHHQAVPFACHGLEQRNGHIMAHCQKDAGDDPDITHGIIVSAEIIPLPTMGATPTNQSPTIALLAGSGVGMVTRLGLPLPVGAPAITPRPQSYIRQNISDYLHQHPDLPRHWQIILHLERGAELAPKTLNPRLGIVGGLSILGTSGVVIPFSCAAWIDSIHRSIDVALAYHQPHLAAATGSVSEAVMKDYLSLPELAIVDMGDFFVAMMKYLKKKNYQGRLTIAGGPGKLVKLAQGAGDLHHGRSRANLPLLAQWFQHGFQKDFWAGHGNHDTPLVSTPPVLSAGDMTLMAGHIAGAQSVAEAMASLPPTAATYLSAIILHQARIRMARDWPTIPAQLMMVDRRGNIMAML